jgi:hypothetical protein
MFALTVAPTLRKCMLSFVKLAVAAFVVMSFGFISHASAQVRFAGGVVHNTAYRPTGSSGAFERLYVISGTDPNGAIIGNTSCSSIFNDPATFPGVALANGAQDFTLLSTGVYGGPFSGELYFTVGTTTMRMDTADTPFGGTAPPASITIGATTFTVSNFTWGASSPYLDRVGFCHAFADGGQDNVGHFTITVTTAK